jgi:hypothetical protein
LLSRKMAPDTTSTRRLTDLYVRNLVSLPTQPLKQ